MSTARGSGRGSAQGRDSRRTRQTNRGTIVVVPFSSFFVGPIGVFALVLVEGVCDEDDLLCTGRRHCQLGTFFQGVLLHGGLLFKKHASFTVFFGVETFCTNTMDASVVDK